ncbi:MAG TPA: glycosyltransferase family 9 protein [Stellaceae bacterium]|nr:glycosyltransferase family 9 protein [Stellaceae bacterium]
MAIAGRAWPELRSGDFPEATPLRAFFAWNEARLLRDRRYRVARDIHALLARFGSGAEARDVCVAHLALDPVILWRWHRYAVVSSAKAAGARPLLERNADLPAIIAARRLVESFVASIGSADIATHADVFRAFEALEAVVDVGALARLRPRLRASPPARPQRNVLVIKLSALGDFVQALGPAAAIRRHHASDRVTLLTTRPYAKFATESGYFNDVVVDERPKFWNIKGWLALHRTLNRSRFDRVYDLQTSDRSSLYLWLFFPGPRPQWSGIAWRCSHPHANLDRYPQHTIDKQAEQLLMAGIYPVPLPACPTARRALPSELKGRRFALLIPGSSPRHLEKRWPAAHFAELARRLHDAGYLPVIVGAPDERSLGETIRAACPDAVDLVGKTDLLDLAGIAAGAALTVGNDTGATHMAAAGGNPVVVLFSRASEPSRCAPRGGLVRVLTESDLADLGVDIVFGQAVALLGPATANDARARTPQKAGHLGM